MSDNPVILGDCTLYLGDCLEVMKQLPEKSVDAVITDPPYFRIKDDDWDRQWKSKKEFLEWLELSIKEWQRILKLNGSLYCFTSPIMSANIEILINNYFIIINNIRWVKENGWHKKADESILRGFLSNWEGIIFAERFYSDAIIGQEYYSTCDELHKKIYAPIGGYIRSERERAGYTRNEVELALGYISTNDPTRGTALCYRWEEGSSLPTKEAYEKMRLFLNSGRKDYEYLRKDYEDLRKDYEDLRKDYEDLRRPFNLSEKDWKYTPHTDTWNFPTVAPSQDKHPCEKPISMMKYIIDTSTKTDNIIIDPFMGSGTTGVACVQLGRKFIGCEIHKPYFDIAVKRIKQAQLQMRLEI